MKMNSNKIAKLAGYMIVAGVGVSILAIVCGAKTNIGIMNGELVLDHPFDAYEKTKEAIVEEIEFIEEGQIVEVSSQTNDSQMINKAEKLKEVKTLDISVDTMDVNVLSGDTYSIDIMYRKDTRLDYRVEGKTLVLRQEDHSNWRKSNMGHKKGTINICIPMESKLEHADIEMGMGSNEIRDVQIEELDLECGMGNVELRNVIVDKAYIEGGMGSIQARELVSQDLDIEMGMGSVEISGDLKNNVNIEGGMGELKLTTAGKETDYNYNMSKGMGSMTINKKRYTSLENVRIDNGAPNNIVIEGGMGSISVNTEE